MDYLVFLLSCFLALAGPVWSSYCFNTVVDEALSKASVTPSSSERLEEKLDFLFGGSLSFKMFGSRSLKRVGDVRVIDPQSPTNAKLLVKFKMDKLYISDSNAKIEVSAIKKKAQLSATISKIYFQLRIAINGNCGKPEKLEIVSNEKIQARLTGLSTSLGRLETARIVDLVAVELQKHILNRTLAEIWHNLENFNFKGVEPLRKSHILENIVDGILQHLPTYLIPHKLLNFPGGNIALKQTNITFGNLTRRENIHLEEHDNGRTILMNLELLNTTLQSSDAVLNFSSVTSRNVSLEAKLGNATLHYRIHFPQNVTRPILQSVTIESNDLMSVKLEHLGELMSQEHMIVDLMSRDLLELLKGKILEFAEMDVFQKRLLPNLSDINL